MMKEFRFILGFLFLTAFIIVFLPIAEEVDIIYQLIIIAIAVMGGAVLLKAAT